MQRAARNPKSETELDDEAIIAYIRAFVNVMAADWRRRQLNAILPEVMSRVDAARAKGDLPDVRAIIDQVWVDKDGPKGLLES